MDVNVENLNLPMDFAVGLKCNNCSCEFFPTDLPREAITTLKNTIIHDDDEVHIWDALAFIYGITWTSIKNYKSEKINEFLKTQHDLRFCSNCTSLLNDNYNSHLQFEHSSDSSSVVQLLKEFRDYQINSTEKENDVQFLSNDSFETVESDIKVEVLEDFVLEASEEYPFQSEVPVELKYEPQSPCTDDFSDKNIPEQIQSLGSPPLRNLRSKKNLVIKIEKLSPEEIIQFRNKTISRTKRVMAKKPRKCKAVKNSGIDGSVKNKSKHKEKSSLEEKIPLVAQNLPKPKNKAYKRTGKSSRRPGSKQKMTFDEKVKLVMEKYKDNMTCPKITVNGRYVCTVCGKTFKEYRELRYKHWRPKHLLNTEDTVCICDICGKSLKTGKYMEKHKLRAHATEDEKNKYLTKCNLCDAMLFSYDLTQHTMKKHGNLQEKCDQCGKVFGNRLSLKSHMAQVHNDKFEKCNFCEKMYKPQQMKCHIKNIHSNREKLICCDLCPQRFFTKAEMERHRVAHSDIRKYVCEECGKTYKYPAHLRQHLKCHKEIATKGELAFTCDLCQGSTFKHSLSLKKHMYTIHGKGKKNYECSVCGKQLYSSTNLKLHEKMHKEIPGFVPRVRTKLPDYIKNCQVSNKSNTTVESQPQPISATEEVDSNSTVNVTINVNI